MKIVIWPHPTLKLVSATVTAENLPKPEFFEEMLTTMKAAGGLGLSAIQVGVPLRIVTVYDTDNSRNVLINPELISTDGERVNYLEGCLSTPGFFGNTRRFPRVKVRYQNFDLSQTLELEADGVMSQVMQHEIEHLDGIMYTDHMKPADRSRVRGLMMKLKRSGKR